MKTISPCPGHFNTHAQGLLLCLCLSAVLAGSTPGAAPAMTDAQLVERGARALLGIPPDTSISLRRGEDCGIYEKGLEYTPYSVFGDDGELGRVLRIKAIYARDRKVDVLALLKKDRLYRLTALEPLRRGVSAREQPGLEALVKPLRDMPVDRASVAMTTMFHALGYLDRVSAGQPVGRESGKSIKYTMKVSQPLPVIGGHCPAFAGKAFEGSLPSAKGGGRPFLVLFTDLDDGLSLEMRKTVYEFFVPRKKKLGLVEIYPQDRGRIRTRIRYGETFAGSVVCDVKKENDRRFRIPYRPYLLCYDDGAVLRYALPYRGMAGTKKVLAGFAKRYLEKK